MSKEVGGMVESRRVQGAGSARLSDQPCRARFPRTSTMTVAATRGICCCCSA